MRGGRRRWREGGREEKNGGMREGEKDYCWSRESEKWSKVDGKNELSRAKTISLPTKWKSFGCRAI